MSRRAVLLAVFTIILAVIGAGAGVAAAHAATVWRSCQPGAKDYLGAYRVVDNAWAGPSSKKFCVSSTGLNISIGSSAIPHGTNVVAYPNVRFGPFWTDGDPQSGLPERVTAIGPLTLNAASRGHAGGTWLTDADIWFRPRANWIRHGTFELVIANRSHTGTTPVAPALAELAASGNTVRIGRTWYGWAEWMTSDPVTGLRWPILVFRQLRQSQRAVIRVSKFVWFARHHGFFHLPSHWWLASVAYGSELWSGGRGLTDSMHVSWPGYPVIGGKP